MAKEESIIKTAPHSKESEMMVLGCMITSVNSLNIAADMLEETDFYFTEHQIIFQVLKRAYKTENPADLHLVAEELKRLDKLETIGGINYLTTLAQYAGTSAYIEEYTQLIRNKAILRRMIRASQEVEKAALEDPKDPSEVLDQAQARFFEISQDSHKDDSVIIRDLLSGLKAEKGIPYLKELQERQDHYQQTGSALGVVGMPSHFTDLDKMIGGFAPSNLMIIAGRPGMGKTAIALNFAENICFKNGVAVGVFSLEMSAEQLLHRIICSQSEVDSDKIRNGSLDGSEYQRIVSCVNQMQEKNFIIDDQPGLKVTDLRSRARRMKELFDIQFLVIDYLQLLSGSGTMRGTESRQIEISEISRMLKNLARELNIPILCGSQLSRKVEERQGHRPMMSDLRESGCVSGNTIIKDADTNQLYTIQQLAERKNQTPIHVWGVNENHKIVKARMTKAFYSGRKVVYRLKTRTGREINASANHPFKKLNGWTRLDQLKIGDKIAVPQKITHLLAQKKSSSEVAPAQQTGSISTLSRTKFRLKRMAKNFLSARGLDIYWDEIIAIDQLEEIAVYDATVEGIHNFVANDIIIHNSLEQDSDVVMFLLRKEYYDPYDKPGQAELIVAKNRHGSTGNITLAFRKEIGQFANFTAHLEETTNNDDAFSSFSPN